MDKANGSVAKPRLGMALDTLHRYGGLTRSAWELSQALSQWFDVVFLTTEAELTGAEKFKVEIVKTPKNWYLRRLWFAWRVTQSRKRLGLDVLNVQGTNGFWQDIVTAHSVHKKWFFWSLARTRLFSLAWILKLLNPVHYMTVAIETYQYRPSRTKRIIAISHQVKNDIVKLFNFPADRIDVVHHGVNCTDFDLSQQAAARNVIRQKLGLGDDTYIVIFVAHEFKRKGLAVLIEAFARVKNPNRCLIVAGQDDPEPFRKLARDKNVGEIVHFVGRQNNIQEWFGASDVFAFPTSYEAFGMVINEAMASSLPVIVPKDAGAAEMMTHGVDGLLLDRWDDGETLVQYLNDLDNREYREKIGANARKRVEAWTWNDAAKATADVLLKAMHSK
jgi:UDP-glucose:(heptosyl)LPS alpha-1,3-glucosyltransferase